MELKTYPRYMYHRNHDKPVRVDSKAEQTDRKNVGWTTGYIHKEYPKWVNGELVRSRVAEDRLLAKAKPLAEVAPEASGEKMPPSIDELFDGEDLDLPTATKEIQIEGQDTAKVVERPKKKPLARPKKAVG